MIAHVASLISVTPLNTSAASTSVSQPIINRDCITNIIASLHLNNLSTLSASISRQQNWFLAFEKIQVLCHLALAALQSLMNVFWMEVVSDSIEFIHYALDYIILIIKIVSELVKINDLCSVIINTNSRVIIKTYRTLVLVIHYIQSCY